MRAVILALTCAFLQTVVALRFPTISDISQEQIKDIGETVELQCSVQYAQDFPILWIKINRENILDQVTLTNGTALLIRDSRFAIKHDAHHDNASAIYTLQIKNIQETDAATYQCRLQLDVNHYIIGEVELIVGKPPIISDNSTHFLVVSEGQPTVLECYASGVPKPRISWRRENNAILPTGGLIYRGNIMTIPAIQIKDRGMYYCVAENGVGRGATHYIGVWVESNQQKSVFQI